MNQVRTAVTDELITRVEKEIFFDPSVAKLPAEPLQFKPHD